jgi:endonuclease III
VAGKKRQAVRRSAKTAKTAVRRSALPAKARIGAILERLYQRYPNAECALNHSNPLELLVATILSAQCTDARVNMTTPHLFAKYKTAGDYAAADPKVFEKEIQSTGFFRNKTKSVIGMAQAVEDRHAGQVPATMDELVRLPGVGRKTANVILGTWFRKNEGVVVDTHVARVSARLGLTRQTDPVKIEQDLMKLVPREHWTSYSHTIIHHGREICDARKPECEVCPVLELCPFGLKETKKRKSVPEPMTVRLRPAR